MSTTVAVDRVPFLDLAATHVELEEQLTSVLKRALNSSMFVGGPMLEEFELAFASYCGTRYCVGVNSGTDALRFPLLAIGVGAGDTVITSPHTFIATSEAISQTGAHPTFVDVDERTGNIDAQRIADFLARCMIDAEGVPRTKKGNLRVKAIVPVHLYGQPADMDPIFDLADRFKLEVIEDACQSHGASYFRRDTQKWHKAGSMGRAAAFSFYPGKNLGACGEAGAVTTNDESVAAMVRLLRDHGQERKYHHSIEGYNGRLDAIQAGFLNIKLPLLDGWNEQRRTAASWYDEQFRQLEGVTLNAVIKNAQSAHHVYAIHVEDRDRVRERLVEQNIETGIHYPIPLHLQSAYKHMGYGKGSFPVSERLASTTLSLPMFPQLQVEQQARVYEALAAAL
jgi:dTDP-4-amino-4,6-dideoxygalactose transaminase